MIINESIMLAVPQKFQIKNTFYKKDVNYRYQRPSYKVNTRFLTERSFQKNIIEYQIGKKMISQLPQIRIDKLKYKSTIYNPSYNFITRDKTKYQNFISEKTQKIKRQVDQQVKINNEQIEEDLINDSDINHFKRNKTQSVQDQLLRNRYSIIIPNIQRMICKKRMKSQILKKKNYKNNISPYSKIKNFNVQTGVASHSISSFIKIERKFINENKNNRNDICSRLKLNFDKTNIKYKRDMSSRIQPWGSGCINNDFDLL